MNMEFIHIIALKDNEIYDLEKKVERYEKSLKEILETSYKTAKKALED